MTEYIPSFVTEQLVARIRGAIAQHDISQARLAVLCDVSQSQFSKIIRGTRPMTLDQMFVIAEAIDADLPALVEQVESLADNVAMLTAPIVYVENGLRLPEPEVRLPGHLDAYGRRAHERLVAAGMLAGGSTVDPAEHIEAVDIEEGVKSAYGKAASRGILRADEPHAE